MATAFCALSGKSFCVWRDTVCRDSQRMAGCDLPGVVSTTICYLLQTACQKYVDETKAAIILSMESVFGTLFSILLLHEVITPRMVAGCTVILAAVIISNLSETEQTEKQKEKA